MDDLLPFPEPQEPTGLDVRVVRINEKEGIIEHGAFVSADYQMRANERYIITESAITITLPVVNAWRAVTIRNNSSGDITLSGGENNINGSASILIATDNTENLVYDGTEWNSL